MSPLRKSRKQPPPAPPKSLVTLEEYIALLEKEIARLQGEHTRTIELMNQVISEIRNSGKPTRK